MRKLGIIILVVLGVAAVVDIGSKGYTYISQQTSQKQKPIQAESTLDVVISPVGTAPVTEMRTYNGNIEPMAVVEVGPQISGYLASLTLERTGPDGKVEKIEVSENLVVKEGEILAKLDYEGLKADWDKAESDYNRALRTEKYAKSEMDRIVGLYKEKGTTEQDRDKAIYEHDLAAEDVNQKRAIADTAKWRYNQAFIKAPFDGVVSTVHVKRGANVGPGTPVLRLVDLAKLKVIANVPNRYIGPDGIMEGVTEVEVKVEAQADQATQVGAAAKGEAKPDAPADDKAKSASEAPVVTNIIKAKVNKIYYENDRVTRTNPIEIVIENPLADKGYKIRGNMYATVAFHVRVHAEAVRVPSDVVMRRGNDNYVFVVDENKIAHYRKVETGIWQGPYLEITSGLKAGEKLVVAGHAKLVEGTKVNIVQELASGTLTGEPPFSE